ncbi:MAG: choice-of-anchor D domain-containing protein, partial [Ignavibacteriae bacterium]|nr:choice-of-anchor D domain-containing protein [Ignavibacteriota bacterium]
YDVTININQATGTNNPTFFTMPIDFTFSASGWDTTVTLFNNQQVQSFTVSLTHDPTSVQLDPNNWILKDFGKAFFATPSSLAFGLLKVGESKTDSIKVKNNGLAMMIFSSVVSDLPQFTVTPSSGSIAVGDSMNFTITFTPTGDGSKTGHINFAHNAGMPDQVTVTGFGYWPRYTHKLLKNWSLVSLPFTPVDPRKSVIFPTASSSAFTFDGDSGYVVVDTLKEGEGYWIKYANDTYVTFIGYLRRRDTIVVKAGWNLLGTLSSPLSVDDVMTEPPGILTSNFFGYTVGYTFTDSLRTSKGYWVKVSQEGILILNFQTTGFEMRSNGVMEYPEDEKTK